MKRSGRIKARTGKLIRAAIEGRDAAEEGTSTHDVAVNLDLDMAAEAQDVSRRARKAAKERGHRLDAEKLVSRASSMLTAGTKPRDLVGVLKRTEAFSSYSKDYLRRVLQAKGILKKRQAKK